MIILKSVFQELVVKERVVNVWSLVGPQYGLVTADKA